MIDTEYFYPLWEENTYFADGSGTLYYQTSYNERAVPGVYNRVREEPPTTLQKVVQDFGWCAAPACGLSAYACARNR
jgi:hypothetical protein